MDEQPEHGAPLAEGDAPASRSTAASAVHVPVLLERCLALLAPALDGPGLDGRGAVVVDATLGLAGHAEALLQAHPNLTLVGLDRDPAALTRSQERLVRYADRLHLVHAVYDRMPDVLAELGYDGVDGVLFDLGVSSMQLDVAERGFGYAQDAPLDMRMDTSRGITAGEVVNEYSVGDLARVLRDYGEERFALRIARAIERERGRAPITSTARLAELVRDAIPAATRRVGGHPAKRTFQALRVEVNGELDALRVAVPAALDALRVGGRMVAMSYQSLEDRIVKQSIAALATDTTPEGLPVMLEDHRPYLRVLTRGAEVASEAEIAANPRAASVRLRAVERIRASA
jgi:16S rRNA (cytosine1402-N4)-methyltransferase